MAGIGAEPGGIVDRVHELAVVGVRVEMPSNQPIVLLREVGGDRYLPIWIGAVEATSISSWTPAAFRRSRTSRFFSSRNHS